MHEDKNTLERGKYHFVYVMLHFKKEVVVGSKQEQADIEDDTDEEEMEDVELDYYMKRHCNMVFKDNGIGLDYKKALLHAKIWYV